MKILLPFVPGLPRTYTTLTTYFLLKKDILTSWDAALWPCKDPGNYEVGLRSCWGLDDLLIWEHDIVPTLTMLEALADCPHPVCAQAYLLHPASSGKATPVYAHRRTLTRFIEEGETQAAFVGFGLTRISLAVQKRIPSGLFAQNWWGDLDTRFSIKLMELELPACIHWPAATHNHQ